MKMGTTPTCTTCSSEWVASAKSTALKAASSASSEPSVASRILVGKVLIAILSFLIGTPSRNLYRLYQDTGLSQGSGDGTMPFEKGCRGLFTLVPGSGILRSSVFKHYVQAEDGRPGEQVGSMTQAGRGVVVLVEALVSAQ